MWHLLSTTCISIRSMKSMQLPLILVLAILLISEGAADAALHLHKDFVLKNESIVIGTEIRRSVA